MTLAELRRWAVHLAFPGPSSLADSIHAQGFIQADPIRSPARAQDLILRHRVESYRSGDLEAHYPSLDIEEDFLYCYGFASRDLWNLLHPKRNIRLKALQKRVLSLVERLGEAHPADLEPHLGSRRTLNAWGGYSKESTRALESLHTRASFGWLAAIRGFASTLRLAQIQTLKTRGPKNGVGDSFCRSWGSLRPYPKNHCHRSFAWYRVVLAHPSQTCGVPWRLFCALENCVAAM